MESKFFETEHLCFSHYRQPLCLNDVSFSINKGEKVLILASKEMGKTTFLSVLSSFESYYFGKILLNGTELKEIPDNEKNFSFLPSIPVFLENKSILDNFKLLSINSVKGTQEQNDTQLKIVENSLKDDLKIQCDKANIQVNLKCKVKNLSLFQKRILTILRSELKNPTILFLDDYFQNLDPENSKKMQETYIKLMNNKSKTILFAIGDESFKNNIGMLKNLPISKVLYLVDSIIKEYKSISEFEKSFDNLNQALFTKNLEYYDATLIKENNKYFILNHDDSYFFISENFDNALNSLSLKNGESEDIRFLIKNSIDFNNLSSDELNSAIQNHDVYLFSKIDGNRLI